MGSLSGKSKSSPRVKRAAPTSFFSPLGNLRQGGGRTVFEPSETGKGILGNVGLASGVSGDILSNLPVTFRAEDAFNNPFFESTSALLKNPIRRERESAERELSNQLTARNQLGGSFEALTRDKFNKRFDDRLTQADNQARLFSFDANNQQLRNALAALQSAQQVQNVGISDVFAPAQLGIANQSALNALPVTSTSGFQENTPSLLSSLLAFQRSNAQAAGSILGGL